MAKWKSGEPKPLAETQAVKWITPDEFDDYGEDSWMREVFEMLEEHLNKKSICG